MAKEFEPIDPLAAKQSVTSDVAARALKREIENILSSYVGWYDPFAELIQNALDAVDERTKLNENGYEPRIFLTIDIPVNQISVTDNGIGLTKPEFEQFLAPSFSFKSGDTRGHKGVGATYLAYGFNYIQVGTKCDEFEALGKMVDARKWLADEAPSGNPHISHDDSGPKDKNFELIDRGVSVTLRFDGYTQPRSLDWLKASTAEQWEKVLRVKTALGAIGKPADVDVEIRVIDQEGNESVVELEKPKYLRLSELAGKTETLSNVRAKADVSCTRFHGQMVKRQQHVVLHTALG